MRKPWKEKPIFPKNTPFRKMSDERGVSPVIAVILMVAITVVLAAVLYVMVSAMLDQPKMTPITSLRYEEDSKTYGTYKVSFIGSVDLDDTEISLYDESVKDSIFFKPSEETYKEIPGGLNITYKDTNENNKLDSIDLILIQGGGVGDEIKFAYVPSGGTMSSVILK